MKLRYRPLALADLDAICTTLFRPTATATTRRLAIAAPSASACNFVQTLRSRNRNMLDVFARTVATMPAVTGPTATKGPSNHRMLYNLASLDQRGVVDSREMRAAPESVLLGKRDHSEYTYTFSIWKLQLLISE